MLLLFLLSLAGLFPNAELPLSLGWKTVTLFDALFGVALARAVVHRTLSPLNRRLAAAAAIFVLAGVVALAVHPEESGIRLLARLGYSAFVFLLAAHTPLDAEGARQLIARPLGVTLIAAWVIFVIENATGVQVGANLSPSLPTYIHRLGGLTGGNALILFVCFAAPLVTHPRLAQVGVLLSGFATLSRSMVGMGVATLMAPRPAEPARRTWAIITMALACSAIGLGLFAYAFAVVPIDSAHRTSLTPSLQSGSYLMVHRADARMFAAQPITGVGPGNAVSLFATFTNPQEREKIADAPLRLAPHSAILGLAAEQGLVGLFAFAWLMFEIYRRFGRSADPEQGRRATAALTGLLVGGFFVDWLTLKGLWLWIGFLVAASNASDAAPSRS